MPRIRTIKPEFFRHEALFDAEVATKLPLRISFAGLWTVADREGRFRWRPRAIKPDILPYDKIDFAAVMDALAQYGFVTRYEVDGDHFGYIPSFKQHQCINVREAQSILPDPALHVQEHETHVHAHGEKEGKGKEGEMEGKGKEVTSADADTPLHQAVGIYNLIAKQNNWPEVQRITPKRAAALKARLVECGGLSGWLEAIERAGRSDFLTGRTSRSNGHEKWSPDLDFFLQQQSFTKLMEGSYDNRKSAERSGAVLGAIALAAAHISASGDGAGNSNGVGSLGDSLPEQFDNGRKRLAAS